MKKVFTPLKNVYTSLYEGDKLSALKSFIDKNKIKKINKGVDNTGTGLKGYVKTTFDNIVSKLGEPIYSADDKVLARWAIQFEDGLIATIYLYKETRIPKEEYLWHVGGPSYSSFRSPSKWKPIIDEMIKGNIPRPTSVTNSMLHNVTRYTEWTELPVALRLALVSSTEKMDKKEILARVSFVLGAPTSEDYLQL